MKNCSLRTTKGTKDRANKIKDIQTTIELAETVDGLVLQVPFLKWAGRKTRILHALKPLLPKTAKRFIEPFVGSGAVFLNTDYPEAVLADSNADLIHLYEVLRQDGEKYISQCKRLFVEETNQEEKFYKLREEFNECRDKNRRAALFVYLNRHCFNGLCRYNASGKFNVPFGRYEKPYFPATEMRRVAAKLATAYLLVQDFSKTLPLAKRGDVVYCDPPYVPLSATASFTAYATGGFGAKEQQTLADACSEAAGRGATVVISNHDTSFTRTIYNGADQIVSLMVPRMISCDGANRNKAKELIAVYQPKG